MSTDAESQIDESIETVELNFVVYPKRDVCESIARFRLSVPNNASGSDLRNLLKCETKYRSRWLQILHFGKLVSNHERLSSFNLRPPSNTLVLVPKPVRLLARLNWWRHQERELVQDSIDAALGEARWPPFLVLDPTSQSTNFTRRHQVWLRRIAQLATLEIFQAVPSPSFLDADDRNNIETGESVFPGKLLQEEKSFALNEVISCWEDAGWQLKRGIELLWNGVRNPADLHKTSSGAQINRHSKYVLNCILITTNIHEREIARRKSKLFMLSSMWLSLNPSAVNVFDNRAYLKLL